MVFTAAKRIGISLDELNEMTLQTLVDIMHDYAAKEKKGGTIRDATQKDIDRYFGRG